MKTPLAWLIMSHNKLRAIVATAGVAFAIILLFMQLGFLGAVESTATLIYDELDFDVLVRSKRYLHFANSDSFPKSRLRLAASLPEVQCATPFYVELNQWRNPQDGTKRGILMIGADPNDQVFQSPELQQSLARLVAPEFLLIDRQSRREFGPANGRRFGDLDVGVQTELAEQAVRIVGCFSLGSGLAANGSVILSDRGFARTLPGRTTDDVSLGLIKVGDNAHAEAVAAKLRRILPPDVEVLTRVQVADYEVNRWVNETQIGVIFQLGVLVSLIVGAAIVYQVLSSDVARHLSEYATLKAMGYRNFYLVRVVFRQALILAAAGFGLAVVLSEGLYRFTTKVANVPIEMNMQRSAAVFGLSVGMCLVSSLIAIRRLRKAEPAALF